MNARRHIWLLAAALTALLSGSCAKIQGPDEGGEWNPLKGDVPIAFSSPLSAPATKTGSLPNESSFGVFAFYQSGTSGSPGAWNGNRTPNFMYNEEVEFDNGDYSYSPLKYWPNNTYNTISFWAYFPYTANPDFLRTSRSEAYSNTTGDIPDIRFSVSDGSVDLMTSDILKSRTKPNPVQFTFHHLLSLIDINVKKQDPEPRFIVKLKTVRFDGIYLTGIHRKSGGWKVNELSNNGNFTAFSGDQTLSTSSSYALDGVMLIPQSLTSDEAKLHIEYSIAHASGGTERPAACDVMLSEVFEDASSKWDKNKHYTLNITITPDDPIEFSVEWSDWGTVYNWQITS